jgi:hypothetical protein
MHALRAGTLVVACLLALSALCSVIVLSQDEPPQPAPELKQPPRPVDPRAHRVGELVPDVVCLTIAASRWLWP